MGTCLFLNLYSPKEENGVFSNGLWDPANNMTEQEGIIQLQSLHYINNVKEGLWVTFLESQVES